MTIAHLAVYGGLNASLYFLQKTQRGEIKSEINDNDKQEEMKESKAVYVTKHNIRDNENLLYQLYKSERDDSSQNDNKINFSCQYDSKKDNKICTCRNGNTLRNYQEMKYVNDVQNQIYAYHGSRSFADIGVGSVKALQRRKVKRVYLPETDDRGVGSSDWFSHAGHKYQSQSARSPHQKLNNFYEHKRTSSKCVGGILEYSVGCAINQKLSPIVQTKSGATSPKTSLELRNTEIGSNTINKQVETVGTQFEIDKENVREPDLKNERPEVNKTLPIGLENEQKVNIDEYKKYKEIEQKIKETDSVYSSDSLVQHVHNLENPSDEKHSRTSFPDPMENKLEREYRKMFTTKSKDSRASYDRPIPEYKSTSMLRRRFDALRRGLVKKNESNYKKPNALVPKTSTRDSLPSRKDVSITSDPPSLIARSFSNTKKHTPEQNTHIPTPVVITEIDKKKVLNNERYSTQWQTNTNSESQGVKGMFKLWGKKFNFEEDSYNRQATPMPSYAMREKSEKEDKPSIETKPKKEGRKFSFFKRRSKDKNKAVYKPKKDVTAGRCEVTDGLTLNIVGSTFPEDDTVSQISEQGDISRKIWFKNFVSHTIESTRSVNVRWNNNLYATSSSTVFELMDVVYKNTEVVLRSKSETTTEESSFYKSYTKHRVNFVQDVEAWMIPKTMPDRPKEIPVKINSNKEIKEKNIEVSISDNQKWLIDKFEAFSHNVEVVLHSNDFNVANNDVSSEYLRIDIPKDFFNYISSETSKRNHTSDEEVYKIVEYETNSEIKRGKAVNYLEKSDSASNEIKVTVKVQDSHSVEANMLEAVIRRPPMHRDVVIQGSNVNIPKRCDVIGVGIITQRDLRELGKPLLNNNIQDDLSEEESDQLLQTNQKKCEFAESYLQDYYRNWTPLGMDLFSWCLSDSHLRSCSEKSIQSFHNQGDGSKSCPNIYDDFQTATIVSCDTSSCDGHCVFQEETGNSLSSKFFNNFKNAAAKSRTESDVNGKRVLPKDSVEVFKRRKLYAISNKANWGVGNDNSFSNPSIESKGVQNVTPTECPSRNKSKYKQKKQKCKKHVSLPDCETMNELAAKQLSDRPLDSILKFKGSCEACKQKGSHCLKHIVLQPKTCEIPQPPCKSSCEKMAKPSCDKRNSPSCNVPITTPPCGTPVCPKRPLPYSNLSGLPRCYPHTPPCKPPPCPASLPPCPGLSPKKPASLLKPCTPPPCTKQLSPLCLKPPPPTCVLSPCPSKTKKQSLYSKAIPVANKPLPCTKCNTPTKKSKPPCKKHCKQPPCKKYPADLCHSCSSCGTSISPKSSRNYLSPKSSATNCKKCCLSSESSSAAQTPCSSPKHSPSESIRSGMSLTMCPSPPKKKEKLCNTSPCADIKKKIPKFPCQQDSQEFPWPMNSQISNPPSPKKGNSPCCTPPELKTNKRKVCKKECSLKPTCSSQSIIRKKEKRCKPNCSSRRPAVVCPSPPKCPSPPRCLSPPKYPTTGKRPLCPNCPPPPKCPSSPPKCLSPPMCPPPPKCPPSPPRCPSPRSKYPPASTKCPPPNSAPCRPKTNKSGISGLFLKMKPSKKKTCAEECLGWNSETEQAVVELSSHEKITINLKQQTPSTEEIREGMHIKVKDEDGNTLYERRDYTCDPNRKLKPSGLGDKMCNSNINRVVTTPIALTNMTTAQKEKECAPYKSDPSLANLIELQLKLCVTQGDKTTEINVGNNNDAKQEAGIEIGTTAPEVFIVKNEAEIPEEANSKNDINIKITVRNYRQKHTKHEKKHCDDFSKKISDKFHTVSTGYSDVVTEPNNDKIFSIHRVTINLSSSVEKSKTISKASNELVSNKDLTEKELITTVSSHSTGQLPTDMTEDEINENKSISTKIDSRSEKLEETNTIESDLADFNDTDDQDTALFCLNTSDECNVDSQKPNPNIERDKIDNKEDKKALLKKVMQKAHKTKSKNKEAVRQWREMLKIILTDSSDNENLNTTSNDLVKDVTYSSLKPNFFRGTDSMSNYYQLESNVSSVKGSKMNEIAIYPTVENSSGTSKNSETEANDVTFQGCMCSRVAERLNECKMNISCCCRRTPKNDGETNCDMRNDEDLWLFNYKTEYVNVETQNSKHLTSKVNSLNVSVHSKNEFITKTEGIEVDEIKKASKVETKVTMKITEDKRRLKICEMKGFDQNMNPGMSDDKLVVLKERSELSTEGKQKAKSELNIIAADVLQSYATKKAVLEIYAEKTENGKHLIAKLPKFVSERESEITRNYEKIATNSYKSVCRQNVVMMSVKR